MTRREILGVIWASAAIAGDLQSAEEMRGTAEPTKDRGLQLDKTGMNMPVVKVRNVIGVPTFTLGLAPFTIPAFETYVPELKYYREFACAGTEVFEFSANASRSDYGQSKPTWLAPNEWDYSQLDERARRVLSASPEGMIFPRVYIGTPAWWLNQNAEEMEILDDGTTMPGANLYAMPGENRPYPSIASEKWRKDIGYGLRHLIEHIQRSDYADRMFGYVLSGLKTEEWYHWDSGADKFFGYSKPTVLAFRHWLKKKYEKVERLRAAWNNPRVDFEAAPVPSRSERLGQAKTTFRDPSREMNVIDFYVFWNELIPETIDYFARVAKDATKGTKVIGAYYAYMYEFGGNPEFGHNALGKFIVSSNLDFVAATASYGDRQLGAGGDYQRAPSSSVMLHGKLWYHDNDAVSYLAPEIQEKGHIPTDLIRLGYTKNATETIWMYRRGAGFVLCNGMYEALFDLHGGYFDAPELMAEVARLNRMWDMAKDYDRASCSEILIVSDENSCSYCSFNSEMLSTSLLQTQWQLIKIGAPADHILVDDLELLDIDRYKLVVFLNTYNLTDVQRSVIDQKVKNGNRTVLWCYAPGVFNDTRESSDLMYRLTGMKLVASQHETFIAPQIEIQESGAKLNTALRKANLNTMGSEKPMCKLISVQDPHAIALGILPGTASITFAMKDMGAWTSFYAITSNLPAAFYRVLARHAGVHIYNDRDDTFYANKSYASLNANGAGVRAIQFPRKCDLIDAITRKRLATTTDNFSYDFKSGETLILRLS